EYQVSAFAFLNWLVRIDRLATNPLAKVDKIETRGKQVRELRAFTENELWRLFVVAGRRLPAYLLLLFTWQRKEEVRALVWGDLHLDELQPYVLIRESTTKDKDKRAVPLHSRFGSDSARNAAIWRVRCNEGLLRTISNVSEPARGFEGGR